MLSKYGFKPFYQCVIIFFVAVFAMEEGVPYKISQHHQGLCCRNFRHFSFKKPISEKFERRHEDAKLKFPRTVLTTWSPWSSWCNKERCIQKRRRRCSFNCDGLILKEERACKKQTANKLNCDKNGKQIVFSQQQRRRNRKKKKPPFYNKKEIGLKYLTLKSIKDAEFKRIIQVRNSNITDMLRKKKKAYSKWSRWTVCTKSCVTQRYRWCKRPSICGNDIIQETAYCYLEGSYCEKWIQKEIEENRDEYREENTNFSGEYFTRPEETQLLNKPKPLYPDVNSFLINSGRHFDCGIAKNSSSSHSAAVWNMFRIIGGHPTRKGYWPWQVALLNRYKEAFCGGTMISPQWIVTAAHCVRKRLYARLGEHDLAYKEGSELEFKISKSVKHPEYNPDTVDNDIALLKIPSSVKLKQFQTVPACLPNPYQSLPTTALCTIIGWGKRRLTDAYGTDILHQAQVPIVSTDDCRNVYDGYRITENMFCAGYRRGRMDSCAGDSGGPLLCQNVQTNRWTIFGITSFGEGCGKQGKFGIYTKLPNYINWVKRVMKIYS